MVAPAPAVSTASPGMVGQQPGLPPGAVASTSGLPTNPGAPDAAPTTSEPTVVSSSNISDNVIPQNNQTLTNWDSGGITVGEDGIARYSDGSYAEAPSGATQSETDGTYSSGGITYAVPPNGDTDPDVQDMYDQLNAAKASADAGTLSTIQGIQSSYGDLITNAKSANQGANKATRNAMLLNGDTRYSPADAASETTLALNKGLNEISDLTDKENAAIQKAQTAGQNNDQKLMDQWLTIAKQTRQDKQTAASKLQTQVNSAKAKAATASTSAAADSAIIGQVANGTNDVGTIVSTLQGQGLSVTAKQVAATIKALSPAASTSGSTFKFNPTEVGKMLTQGISMSQINSLSDFYNGTGDSSAVSALSSDQQSFVRDLMNPPKTVKAGSTAKASSSGSLSYTSATLGQIQSWVDATKGTDGYVDPNAYQEAFNAWISDGGLAKDFLKNFPPKSYINPANTWLPEYLESKTTSSSSSSAGISQADINALFPSSQ